MRATIATAGVLRREDVPAALKEQLLATFREGEVAVIAYKFLRDGEVAPFTGFTWPVGEWVRADDVELCRSGIHACRPRDLPFWLGRHLWEIELAGEIVEQERKVVAQRGRLLERLGTWTPVLLDEFMDDLLRRTRRRFGAVAVAGRYVADISVSVRSGASAWRRSPPPAPPRRAGPRAYGEGARARRAGSASVWDFAGA